MFRPRHIFLTIFIAGLLLLPLTSQVRIPKVTQSYRGNFFDVNWVDKLDRKGVPLSDYSSLSAEDHIRHLVTMNADSLLVFAMSIWGYTFYDSKIAERHPTLKYDYLKEMIRLGHEKGIAMELYLPTMYNDRLVQRYPTWGIRNPDGSLFRSAYGGYHADLNSPAADWYVRAIEELVPAYGADALFIDGISFMRYGQSEFTVKKFRMDTGRDYPRSLQEDSDWRATLRWEVDQVERFWLKMKEAGKRRNPQLEMTLDKPGPEIQMPGAVGEFVPVPPHVNKLTDYAYTQAGRNGEYSTWMRGIVHPTPFRVTFLNRHSILDPAEADELRAHVGRTIAVGGLIYHSDRTSVNGAPNAHSSKLWGEVFAEVKRKEPYLSGADPVKHVAVVSSEPTMLYRGRMDWSNHANDMIGAMRMLDMLHVQYDVLPDWDLDTEKLRHYQLVLLPNTGCMSDRQAAAIREFVRNGGAVLATAESSLFDENGKARADFALGDVFGVRLDEAIKADVQTGDLKPPVYFHPGEVKHPVFRGLPETELIIPGDSSFVQAVQGIPLARLITDAGTPMNAPLKQTQWVAIHANTFGRGKSLYICGAPFARSTHHRPYGEGMQAASDSVQWTGPFIINAVRYLSPDEPWRIQASQKIWAGLNYQRSMNRHVLHLVNWQPDLKATNVEFSLPAGSAVGRRATVIWPSRLELQAVLARGERIYSIPEIGPHVMIEFAQPAARGTALTGQPARQ